jgi:hypothetical protein
LRALDCKRQNTRWAVVRFSRLELRAMVPVKA